MNGLMMDFPLTLHIFMRRVTQYFPQKEIVTRYQDGYHRYNYREWYDRVQRLANVLNRLGIQQGDRVGTIAWNTYRHFELYYAVPCMGAVLHTLNLRLPEEDLVYIINHAADRVIFVDDDLYPIIAKIADRIPTVEHIILMSDTASDVAPTGTLHYEDLLSAESPQYDWPELDENAALGMCYTSGTTGKPKGVVYSHRAIVLHTLTAALNDSLDISEADVVMPVVPLFHALGWGFPFVANMLGSKLVLPNRFTQPEYIAQIIHDEGVTISAGVPSVWLPLQSQLASGEFTISQVNSFSVGGSAAPPAMIKAYEKLGIQLLHCWGMTEISPLGTVSRVKSNLTELPEDERDQFTFTQGLPVPCVELRGVDENGEVIPWDGETMGELQVRGPFVVKAYYNDERNAEAFSPDGWFRTGDVTTINSEGYIQLVDRTKDLVKSGGEWISSIDLENVIMSHPRVSEAAVIAIPHERWQERPLAIVVAGDGPAIFAEIYELLLQNFAKWQLPDDLVFVDEIAKTSTGKFDKKKLRSQYSEIKAVPEV